MTACHFCLRIVGFRNITQNELHQSSVFFPIIFFKAAQEVPDGAVSTDFPEYPTDT